MTTSFLIAKLFSSISMWHVCQAEKKPNNNDYYFKYMFVQENNEFIYNGM